MFHSKFWFIFQLTTKLILRLSKFFFNGKFNISRAIYNFVFQFEFLPETVYNACATSVLHCCSYGWQDSKKECLYSYVKMKEWNARWRKYFQLGMNMKVNIYLLFYLIVAYAFCKCAKLIISKYLWMQVFIVTVRNQTLQWKIHFAFSNGWFWMNFLFFFRIYKVFLSISSSLWIDAKRLWFIFV